MKYLTEPVICTICGRGPFRGRETVRGYEIKAHLVKVGVRCPGRTGVKSKPAFDAAARARVAARFQAELTASASALGAALDADEIGKRPPTNEEARELGEAILRLADPDVLREHGITPTVPVVALDPHLAKSLKNAGDKVRHWTIERDSLIRTAVAEGGSLREVGAAVGLSHQAVKFIAHGRG